MPAHHFIANTRLPVSDALTIPVIDPADGQAFDRIARGSPDDIDRAVQAAQAAMGAVLETLPRRVVPAAE